MFLVFYQPGGASLEENGGLNHLRATERAALRFVGGKRQTAIVDLQQGIGAAPVRSTNKNTFIVGRIRLDGGDELRTQVLNRGGDQRREGQAALCLSAYERWGSEFCQKLRGEFCFALWDDHRQRLIAVIDQFATRPLYWAWADTRTGRCWIISDNLGRLASVPGVSLDLDRQWIGDYLANLGNLDQERTIYRGVRRVPAGHRLVITADSVKLSRYWQLSLGEPIHYPKSSRYVEEFHDRLGQAIKDRLPPGRVGLTLSGGLDSSALAAKLVEITGKPEAVIAQTSVFRHLIPDDEAKFSSLVAKRLGIRHQIDEVDDEYYDAAWWEKPPAAPEPTVNVVTNLMSSRFSESVGKDTNVWLYGEGPDNALTFEWRPFLRWQRANGDFLGAATTVARFIWTSRGRDWLTALKRVSKFNKPWINSPIPTLPDWLSPDFAREIGLEVRIMDSYADKIAAHPWRPKAIASLTNSNWASLFESLDPSFTGGTPEWRHPYLDLRVVDFMLAMPPIPWSREKNLIRMAMHHRLPVEVLTRPKTPLRGDPIARALQRHPLPMLPKESPVRHFADIERLNCVSNRDAHTALRVHALNHWLLHYKHA